jgi:CRISPR system Cascade subunit CasC
MTTKFLQIHTLTSYPASLLNRDDAGFAKRMPFGGAVRTRISSQCLKRHWRVFDGENSLKTIRAPESVRSRVSFEKHIVQPLVREGVPADVARVAASKIIGKVFGSEAKKEKAKGREGKNKGKTGAGDADPTQEVKLASTAQVTVLGLPELEYLCQLAREAIQEANGEASKIESVLDDRMKNDKKLKENIQALKPGCLEAGLGAALFGRMVTGDILARTDAAIHVAHAVTVHGQMTESDYFSAIDDLVMQEGEQGSGHINASELTSGLYYGYVVVDVDGLLANLGDDREMASVVVEKLVHLVATVSPGAKKGSTAPYAYSHLVLVESGGAQPRTLANAFLEPVRSQGNVVLNAERALAEHLMDLDAMYETEEARAHAGLGATDKILAEARMHSGEKAAGETKPLGEKKKLAELAAWARKRVLA